MKQYALQRGPQTPTIDGHWNAPNWSAAAVIAIDEFHEQSSEHRPTTQAKVLYDEFGLYVIFRVDDRYVRCIETNRNGRVWEDSCVEFFVAPVHDRGYFNIEINCGGTPLIHYNAQSASVRYDPVELDNSRIEKIKIYHSLPPLVNPERTEPTTWIIEFFVPYDLFEAFVGPVAHTGGTEWRANFYKCGDATSHPHWGMWNRIPGEPGFHQPEYFGSLKFQ